MCIYSYVQYTHMCIYSYSVLYIHIQCTVYTHVYILIHRMYCLYTYIVLYIYMHTMYCIYTRVYIHRMYCLYTYSVPYTHMYSVLHICRVHCIYIHIQCTLQIINGPLNYKLDTLVTVLLTAVSLQHLGKTILPLKGQLLYN